MLRIHRLERDRIAQAFPVIREAAPAVDVARWRAFARTRLAERPKAPTNRGIMVAETADGHIRGLFAFEVESSLDRGAVLVVRHFVVPGLGRSTVAEALYRAVRDLAQDLDCAAISFEVPPETTWEIDFLRRHGHQVVTWLLAQAVSEPAG